LSTPRIVSADDPAAVDDAARALLSGELVAFPTETVYGLAALRDNPEAVERLYRTKQRPREKPLAVFAADVASIQAAGAGLNRIERRLAQHFWPGPLTLVLSCGAEMVGFRVPDHPVPLAVLKRLGRLLYVTSANRSGRPPCRSAAEVAVQLGGALALIIDGGNCADSPPSTVVSVRGGQPVIIRSGAITPSAINEVAFGDRDPGRGVGTHNK